MAIATMKDLDVSVLLSRISGGVDEFRLTVTDRDSRLRVIEVTIQPESMADLMSGRQFNAMAELCAYENIGRRHEIMHITLTLSESNAKALNAAIDAWNATALIKGDGWAIPDRCREWNSHCFNYRTSAFNLHAERYVDVFNDIEKEK